MSSGVRWDETYGGHLAGARAQATIFLLFPRDGASGSQQGLDVLKRILNSKKPVVQPAGNGGYRIFDGATGRGFGLSRDGLFNGFREL